MTEEPTDVVDARDGIRHAAVLGSPIAHSRSPDLHLAAYRALGLRGWTYERIECGADDLAGLVDGLDGAWVGLSVTMPAKVAALARADTATGRARRVGSANTLVRGPSGWHADCTDIDGVAGALAQVGVRPGAVEPGAVEPGAVEHGDVESGASAILIGAGGTARPALAALASAGVSEVVVVVRDPSRASSLLDLAADLGVVAIAAPFTDAVALRDRAGSAAVVVSTVPADAAAALAPALAACPRLVDAIYHPWPTPLAEAVRAHGGVVAGGLVMLVHQAFTQVELFTGRRAPREAMTAAVTG